MEPRTDWDSIPDTHTSAAPTSWRQVSGVRAVHAPSARIRCSSVSGYFEIADVLEPFRTRNGRFQVEVKCLWFGRKPPTTWMHLTLLGDYAVHEHYTGPVVENISKG